MDTTIQITMNILLANTFRLEQSYVLSLYHIYDENHKENPYCSSYVKRSTSIAVEHSGSDQYTLAISPP